jgi:prophage DNA circulation protein
MMADTLLAKIDDFPLEIETIEDSIEKSIAKYEFPYRDGALLEDMGQKARIVKIKCYFYGETYEKHIQFLKHLEDRELFELSHPKYGVIKGFVESVSVRHDDKIMAAEIDITFAESLLAPEPRHAPSVDHAVEKGLGDGQQQAAAALRDSVKNGIGKGADTVLNRTLDPNTGILAQFSDITGTARDFVTQLDSCVNTLESALNTIANPANSLVATINYAADLPGRVIGTVARTLERYSILYDSIKNAPVRFVQSFKDGVAKLKDSLPASSKNAAKQAAIDAIRTHIQIAAAQRLALDLAYIYKDDETARQKQKGLEKAKSFDIQGNYIKPEPPEPILTIGDIEKSVADVRTEIQTAVDAERSLDSLKDMARQLLFHVNTIKLEREKIRTVEIDNSTPLHLVCLRYGLPYAYAERIHAINAIKNPSFVSGEVSIYAR